MTNLLNFEVLKLSKIFEIKIQKTDKKRNKIINEIIKIKQIKHLGKIIKTQNTSS